MAPPDGTPVMASAARLKVRTLPAGSVVARPLGRLSMTCWLNACRPAISVEACSSRTPADLKGDADGARDGGPPKGAQAPDAAKAASKSSGAAQRVSTGRSTPSKPASGENSLYRIDPDGSVRELLRQPALMLALARRREQILIGTGQQARLFEVDETRREHTPVARVDQGEILSLLRRTDGSIVFGTGNPGKLYALAEDFAAEGTYLSPILDSGLISRWGAIRWSSRSRGSTRFTALSI